MRDFLTDPNAWYVSPVEVTIPRHGFTDFVMRAVEACNMASMIRSQIEPTCERVYFYGPAGDLTTAIKPILQPGEALSSGCMTWWGDHRVILNIEPDQREPDPNECFYPNTL